MNNLTYPLAIIDIGSNSVRSMFVSENGTRDKVTVSTRLGEGLSFSAYLNEDAINRTVKAVVELYATAVKRGAKQIYAFATAAVRNSKNGNDLVNAVKNAIGLTVDVVSGELEAELSLQGATLGVDGGVIDVGGASSEVCVKQGGNLIYGYSLKMGAVKLYDGYGRNYEAIKSVLTGLMQEYKQIPTANFKAVGGTATSLASVDLNLKTYDPTIVDGHYISKDRLEVLTEKLFSLSPEEIANNYCVGRKRADVIAGGSAIILSILKYANIAGITVSESDNLEGYLLHLGGSL